MPRSLQALLVRNPRDIKETSPAEFVAVMNGEFAYCLLADQNGAYLEKCAIKPLDDIYPWGLGDREARKMWEWSEKILKQKFEY